MERLSRNPRQELLKLQAELLRAQISRQNQNAQRLQALLSEKRSDEAEQASPKRMVAIKVVRQLHKRRDRLVSLFVDEARVSFLLSHPNIIQTYDIGQVEGNTFLVLEYVDGANLERLLERLREMAKPMPSHPKPSSDAVPKCSSRATALAPDTIGRPSTTILT